MAKIMGIDPSLTGCGLVLIINGDLKVGQTISTPADWARGKRLAYIANEIEKFWMNYRPQYVAMEGYAFGSAFNREAMGEVGGVIKARVFLLTDYDPVIWPNTSWKKAVLGRGGIKKEDIKLPLFKKYNVEIDDMNQVEAFCVAMAEHLAQRGLAARPVEKLRKVPYAERLKKASDPAYLTKLSKRNRIRTKNAAKQNVAATTVPRHG